MSIQDLHLSHKFGDRFLIANVHLPEKKKGLRTGDNRSTIISDKTCGFNIEAIKVPHTEVKCGKYCRITYEEALKAAFNEDTGKIEIPTCNGLVKIWPCDNHKAPYFCTVFLDIGKETETMPSDIESLLFWFTQTAKTVLLERKEKSDDKETRELEKMFPSVPSGAPFSKKGGKKRKTKSKRNKKGGKKTHRKTKKGGRKTHRKTKKGGRRMKTRNQKK